MALGILVLLVSLLLPRLKSLPEGVYSGTCAAVLGVGTVVLTVRGWRTANRLLRERRNRDRDPA
jgi:hypothetical protein